MGKRHREKGPMTPACAAWCTEAHDDAHFDRTGELLCAGLILGSEDQIGVTLAQVQHVDPAGGKVITEDPLLGIGAVNDPSVYFDGDLRMDDVGRAIVAAEGLAASLRAALPFLAQAPASGSPQ